MLCGVPKFAVLDLEPSDEKDKNKRSVNSDKRIFNELRSIKREMGYVRTSLSLEIEKLRISVNKKIGKEGFAKVGKALDEMFESINKLLDSDYVHK
jgi:hypothetical protein